MAERQNIRANWHNYQEGLYFVTICCADKTHYFGEIDQSNMRLSPAGEIAKEVIEAIPGHHIFKGELCNYVIMPNHIHIVLSIDQVGARHGAPAQTVKDTGTEMNHNIGCLRQKQHGAQGNQNFHHNSHLSVVIGQLKSTIKRLANKRNIEFKWQTRFHDHIIRSQRAYDLIMRYVDMNVENWRYDTFHPIPMPSAPWARDSVDIS